VQTSALRFMAGDIPHAIVDDHVDLTATWCDTREMSRVPAAHNPAAPTLTPAAALTKVRKACLALPDVSERPSHGMPAWFVGKNQFCVFSNDHHGDGRLAIVCAGSDGAQAMLVDADPEAYYVPPYVGHRGWIGVRLDLHLPWSQIASVIEAAHACRRVIRRTRSSRRTT
jgi:hypothetical protein